MTILQDDENRALKHQAFYSGLGNLGAGLLAAAYSRNPGPGIMAGLQGMNQASDPYGLMRVQLAQSQLEDAERSRRLREQQQKTYSEALKMLGQGGQQGLTGPQAIEASGVPGPNAQAANLMNETGAPRGGQMDPRALAVLGGMSPDKGLPLLFEQMTKERRTLQDAAGFNRYADTGQRVFPGVEKPPEKPLTTGNMAWDPVNGWQEIPGYQEGAIERAQAGRNLTNINMPPDEKALATAQGGKLGGYFADLYINSQEAERAARTENARMNAIENAFEGAYTGFGAGGIQLGKKAARFLGIEGLDEEIAAGEAGSALANELALQLRNPAGGAGMPGSMSDADRAFLQSMSGGLAASKDGRKLMFDVKRALNRRSIEVAAQARKYYNQNGGSMEGFDEHLSNLYAEDRTKDLFSGYRDRLEKIEGGSSRQGAPSRKTIGGKTYIEDPDNPGEWFEVIE